MTTAASDPALNPEDPRRTIHFAITRAVSRRMRLHPGSDEELFARWATQDDPESRADYAFIVGCCWGLLAAGCVFAMAAIGIALGLLVGRAASVVVAIIGLGAGFFCLAGMAEVFWRKYTYQGEAKRLVDSPGRRDAYASAMRNMLPRNSSVIFQSAVAVVTVIAAALSV